MHKLIAGVMAVLIGGCAGVELDRSTLDRDLVAAIGSTEQVVSANRCEYGVSSLNARSARFQWDGVCVVLKDGFAFLSYNKATQRRELEFRLKRSDVAAATLLINGRRNQIQLTTNVARVSFNISADTGALLDSAVAQQVWQNITDQGYPATVAQNAAFIFDERGQVMVLPIIK